MQELNLLRYVIKQPFHGQNTDYHQPELSPASDYGKGAYVSWVLMLEPVPEKKDTVRRVGMGVVLSNSWAERERIEKLVHIV